MEPNRNDLELPEPEADEAVTEVDAKEALEKRFRNGASWFFWVAGLSLVNSVVALFDGEWGFIFGLGVTQAVDAIAWSVGQEAPELAVVGKAVGFGVDFLIVGLVALMGWLAHKRMVWVFVVGLVLYAGDALLCLVVGDFLGLAFHGFVFFVVTSGLMACRQLKLLDAPPVAEAFSPA